MAAVTPRTIVHYPIAGDNDNDKSGTLLVFGRADAPKLAILCAGYPDDQTVFSPFASRLAIETDCLVGVTCLPGYDRPYVRCSRRGGYTFEEMVSSMRQAIRALRVESSSSTREQVQVANKKKKLIGIFHDWGVMPGMVYTNRTLQEEANEELTPDQLVIFDVLGPPHSSTQNIPMVPKEKSPLYTVIVTWTYRVLLAICFALQRYVSKTLALIYFGLSFSILVHLRLNPTLKIDAKTLQQRKMDYNQMIYMAYPYFNLFRAAFTGRIQHEFQDMCLPADLNKTPVLYMYGLQKRIMFHNAAALMVLEREARKGRKSRAIAVPNAGHWLYLQQPDVCLESVKSFIFDK